jgi:hypothetical protein
LTPSPNILRALAGDDALWSGNKLPETGEITETWCLKVDGAW